MEPTEYGQAEFSRLMGELLAKQKGRILRQTGIDPTVIQFDPFWQGEDELLRPKVTEIMSQIAGQSAMELVNRLRVADPDDVNGDVLRWVLDYSFNLVKGINQTSRAIVSQALEAFVTSPGMTRGELVGLIAPTFGPVRAEMIAVTETTRAYAEGNAIAADRIRAAGVSIIGIWNTNNDGLVCSICGPLNGVKESNPGSNNWNGYSRPPAHPRCRCWITQEIVDVEG